MKILITIKTSSHSPANTESSAVARASPPAENVPNPRLNPLLSVAPAQKHSYVPFQNKKTFSYSFWELEKSMWR